MREAEADPYLRVIEGAREGALLIDKAILRRNEKQQWVVSLPGQDPVFLLGPTDPGPSKPLRILAASHFWEIKVVKVAVPRSIPGVATEEEVKLTLHILRISPDSPS